MLFFCIKTSLTTSHVARKKAAMLHARYIWMETSEKGRVLRNDPCVCVSTMMVCKSKRDNMYQHTAAQPKTVHTIFVDDFCA